jgi:hypothetical protein
MTYFAPLQPVLGVAGLVLTLAVLRRRIAELSGACAAGPMSSAPATR